MWVCGAQGDGSRMTAQKPLRKDARPWPAAGVSCHLPGRDGWGGWLRGSALLEWFLSNVHCMTTTDFFKNGVRKHGVKGVLESYPAK